MIRKFDSIAEERLKAIELGVFDSKEHRWYRIPDIEWYGGETIDDVRRKSETGDVELVPEAEKLLSKLETTIEVRRKIWERAPAGAFGVVPDVIAGLPTPMRRLVHTADDHAPITVLSIVTCSAGIGAKTLRKRGTAILALVMALSQIRPVSLHAVSIGDGTGARGESVVCARINTAPLDVATAAYTLTSAGYVRRLCYGIQTELGGCRGYWPDKFRYGNFATGGGYYDYLAQQLSPDPVNTLVIPAAQLHDPILKDPVQWINNSVRRFTKDMENAA